MKRSDSDRGQADTLRDTLRAQTRESHHRVDHLIGALDLTSLEGMSDFLATNYLAYSSVKERLKPYEGFTLPLLPLDEIEADLDVLGRSVPRWRVPPFGEAMHPVGMIYVLAGSRLGAVLPSQGVMTGIAVPVVLITVFVVVRRIRRHHDEREGDE